MIHLAQIGKLRLFSVFSRVCIPKAVFREVCIEGRPGEKELRGAGNIETLEISGKNIERIKGKVKNYRLGEGEFQALCLCDELGKNIFLTDDLEAREAGKHLGFEVHGSVGIVVRAYKNGLLNLAAAKRALDDLYRISKLFVARAIVEKAIEELERFRF